MHICTRATGIRHLQCIGEGSANETLAYPRVSADRSYFSAALASFSYATARIDHFPIGKYIFVLYIDLPGSASLSRFSFNPS